MSASTWLCPHCYEEEHPDEVSLSCQSPPALRGLSSAGIQMAPSVGASTQGWICNSSICMTRRGLKPTGIAIYDAQQRGFPSVAHFVQASSSAQHPFHV